MSAIVLAGLELTAGAEPTAIITEESELPKSAICHITRATLVPCATPSTFYIKASISDSQDIVLAAVSSSQPSVGLDLVFHADSTPMFSVTSVPELKGEAKQKFTVHLSGYVDVELDEDDMGEDDDDDDEEGGEELTAEEMAAMREAIKRGEFDDEDGEDDDDEDEEPDAEGEEQEAGGEEDEDEEEEQKQAAPAPAKKGAAVAAAAGNKRKQSPTKETAPTPAAKQQKTAPAASTTTPSASTKQAKSTKAAAAPTTTTAASSPAATILPSGLTIQDELVGIGAEANNGRKVSIRYKGQLVSNGKVFDSNMPKGQPFVFTLGGGECIEGFDKGVKGMRVGGRRVIVVPSELGYGKRGSPPTIPPNAALKFTIELIKA